MDVTSQPDYFQTIVLGIKELCGPGITHPFGVSN